MTYETCELQCVFRSRRYSWSREIKVGLAGIRFRDEPRYELLAIFSVLWLGFIGRSLCRGDLIRGNQWMDVGKG